MKCCRYNLNENKIQEAFYKWYIKIKTLNIFSLKIKNILKGIIVRMDKSAIKISLKKNLNLPSLLES